jgi:predicted nucleic acid-binding protein
MAQSDAPIIGVVNSTPLIALSIVGHLTLLPALFDEIFVPPSVYEEVVQKGLGRSGSRELAQLVRWFERQIGAIRK